MPRSLLEALRADNFSTKKVTMERIPASRRWVFTFKNPSPEEESNIRVRFTEQVSGGNVKFAIVGREIDEDGLTLQGFFVTSNPKLYTVAWSFVACKRYMHFHWMFVGRIHLERVRNVWASDPYREYCEKGGDFYEIGNLAWNTDRTLRDSQVFDST